MQNCGSFDGVFANELAGLVGYDDGADNMDQDAAALPIRGHCTRFIPANGSVFNSTVCQHEAEGILSVYGIRNGGQLSTSFKHIMTGIWLTTGNTTLTQGASLAADVSSLQFSRANPSINCGQQFSAALSGGGGGCTLPTPSQATYSWTSSNPSVVSVTPSGTGATLTASSSVSGTSTITVAVVDPGPYDVATLFNGNGQPASFVVTVNPPYGPDLRVTGISGATTLPLYATAAAGYNLNFRNFGNVGTSSTTWYMSLAMSTDQTYSSGDPRIASSSMSTPMAPYGSMGDAGVRLLFFAAPNGTAPGTYYLVANLDTTNVVAELNETNNTGASAAITLTANGDMVVDNVAGPASVAPGASTTASVTVRNAGTDPARPAQVRVYLSTDNAYQAGDVLIGSLNDTPLMTAGVTRIETVPVTVPVGQPLGNYYLIARVDADSTVYESNEGNNIRASTGQVSVTTPSYPDLIVNSVIQVQTTVTAGQSYLLIKGTARNIGTATAPAGWQGRLYLSADATLDAGDPIVGTVTFGALAPATNQAIALTATVPNVSDGNYYLIYVVDVGGVVAESNEGNNVGISAGTMEVVGLP